MVNIQVLRALQAAGASVDMIIAAVEAQIAEQAGKVRERRAKDAARQRAKRSRENHAESRGVTRTNSDLPPPNEYILTPLLPPQDISNEISPPHPSSDEVRELVEAWNDTARSLGLATVVKLTPKRIRLAKQLIRTNSDSDISAALGTLSRTPFCLGENARGWKADFEFFVRPDSFAKLLEGSYNGKAH